MGMFDKDLMTSKTKLEQIIDRLKEIVDDVVPANITHYNCSPRVIRQNISEELDCARCIKRDVINDVIRDEYHNGDLLNDVWGVEVEVSYKKRIPTYYIKFEIRKEYDVKMQASIKGVVDIKTSISNGTIR